MQGTVDDLKRAYYKAKPQFYPSRQRFTFPLKAGEKKATALADGKKLSDFDVKDGTVLIFKDLGPQVSMMRIAMSHHHHGCCMLTLHPPHGLCAKARTSVHTPFCQGSSVADTAPSIFADWIQHSLLLGILRPIDGLRPHLLLPSHILPMVQVCLARLVKGRFETIPQLYPSDKTMCPLCMPLAEGSPTHIQVNELDSAAQALHPEEGPCTDHGAGVLVLSLCKADL